MSRRKKDPLRPITDAECQAHTQVSRSQTAPDVQVGRVTMILAVDGGDDYQDAARSAGRRSGDAVSHLVARFNSEGLGALTPRHGGGRPRTYDPTARERILREARREPTPEADGTASWSLSTLKGSLRAAPDGLPKIATSTLWQMLLEAGLSYQCTRTWCPTGSAIRQRKSGPALVIDPDAESKKSGSRTPSVPARRPSCRSGAPTRPGRSRRSRIPASPGGPRPSRRGSLTSTSATARPRSSRSSIRPTAGSGSRG